MDGVKVAEIPQIEVDPVTLDIIEGALKSARFEMDADALPHGHEPRDPGAARRVPDDHRPERPHGRRSVRLVHLGDARDLRQSRCVPAT